MSNNDSKQRLIAIAAVVVVALLAVNAFLLYNKYLQDKVIAEQETQLDEQEKIREELNKQYDQALLDLEEYRSDNDELNSILDEKELELAEQKEKISRLIRSGQDLKRARAEINKLTAQNQEFIAQIEELKDEVDLLKGERSQLVSRTETLEGDLSSQKEVTAQLENEKESLTNEKQNLSQQRDRLANTVNFASVIKVKNVNVVGMQIKNSGKTVKKKYAKNVNLLKVCFHTTINEVTNAGQEAFYVRIINPIGETMAIEELGSGKIKNKKTGEEILYTQVREYDYSNDETQLCFNWEPNVPFQKGNYEVEIYNKGHMSGKGQFNLK